MSHFPRTRPLRAVLFSPGDYCTPHATPPTPTEPSKLKLLFVRQTLYGFLRLRIPSGTSPVLPDLKGCALIRELHVYGKLKKVCRCVQVRDVWLSRLS